MAGATTYLDDFFGGTNPSLRDVEVSPFDGSAGHAETMVSLLTDFGVKARVGSMLKPQDGQLFTVVVNRPS